MIFDFFDNLRGTEEAGPKDLKGRLEYHLKHSCELKINENRTTMINLLGKNRHQVRLSIHKMFVDAPDSVIAAIAHYVRGTRKNKREYDQRIRSYIHDNLEKFDKSHTVQKNKLITIGQVYDLDALYTRINAEYFGGRLNLSLTWYGKKERKNGSRIVFGQYLTNLKLVKIHRMLDDPFVPEYFVSFILYHEMLHAHVPVKMGDSGRYEVHGPEFKKLEKRFLHYEKAIAWEKAHKDKFFR